MGCFGTILLVHCSGKERERVALQIYNNFQRILLTADSIRAPHTDMIQQRRRCCITKNWPLTSKQMPPDWHEAYYSHYMNVKVYSWPLNVSQGCAATDLRGGDSFNSSFLRRSFLNLTVKKIMKIGPLVTIKVLPFGAIGGLVIMTHREVKHLFSYALYFKNVLKVQYNLPWKHKANPHNYTGRLGGLLCEISTWTVACLAFLYLLYFLLVWFLFCIAIHALSV